MKRCFFVAATLAGLSCWDAAADTEGYVPGFRCAELRIPWEFAALRKIGKLRSEKVLAERDWGSYKTHDRRLEFDGLVIEVVTFSNDHPYMIIGATITSSAWQIAPDLRIGQPVTAGLEKRGTKGRRKGSVISIAGDTDTLDLKVDGGRVVEIVYSCYTG